MPEQVSPKNGLEDNSEIQIVPNSESDIDEFKEQEEKHNAEHRNLSERREILKQIVNTYGHEPQVKHRVSRFPQDPHSITLYENELSRYKDIMDQFPVIEDRQVTYGFFKDIEAGLQAWRTRASSQAATSAEKTIFINTIIARDILMFSNLRFVGSIARKNVIGSLGPLDLFQEGVFGLNDAIAGFDYRRGLEFSTYAIFRIKGSIKRAVANDSRVVRIPVHAHEAIEKLKQGLIKLIQEKGRDLTEEEKIAEIAKIAGRSTEYARDYLQSGGYNTASLDEPVSDTSNSETIGNFLSEELLANDISDAAIARAAISLVIKSKKLTFDEKLALSLKAGLHEQSIPELATLPPEKALRYKQYLKISAMLGGLAVDEIAIALGVSSTRIYRILNIAHNKARIIIETNDTQEIYSKKT